MPGIRGRFDHFGFHGRNQLIVAARTIDFHGDVDNLRYYAGHQRVYIGYGEDETGSIGAVDAASNERLPEEYRLGAHPESFQLERRKEAPIRPGRRRFHQRVRRDRCGSLATPRQGTLDTRRADGRLFREGL